MHILFLNNNIWLTIQNHCRYLHPTVTLRWRTAKRALFLWPWLSFSTLIVKRAIVCNLLHLTWLQTGTNWALTDGFTHFQALCRYCILNLSRLMIYFKKNQVWHYITRIHYNLLREYISKWKSKISNVEHNQCKNGFLKIFVF